ncbi:MAG: hypothetical protein ACLPKB_22160 [Xanthobacteraceae bacterium]
MHATRRSCSKPGCRRPPRADGRYCKPCFAAANRDSHDRHRKQRNARRRSRARYRDDDARAKDAARAKLYVAIARGKEQRKPCVVCKRWEDLTAYIADPARWREAVWICREHRADEIARRTPAPDPLELWRRRREAALAAIAALPEAERDRLHRIAAQGPAGLRLSPQAPLFLIQLVNAYEKLCAAGSSSTG